MSPARDELPYVDEHAIRIAASREVVWSALQDYAATSNHILRSVRRLSLEAA